MARSSKVAPHDEGSNLTTEQRINLFMRNGLDNDTLFYCMSKLKPHIHVIEDKKVREGFAKKFQIECPPFNKTARQRLMEQIRKCKCAYLRSRTELSHNESVRSDDGTPLSINEIEVTYIERFSVGVPALDTVLGGDEDRGYGMPTGSVLVNGAQMGSGKTRLAVLIASHVGNPLARKDKNNNQGVLYIQNEEKPGLFLGRHGSHWSKNHNIMLSSSNDVDQISGIVNKHRPKLIIVDSISDIRQSRSGQGSHTVLEQFKSVAEDLGCSFWLIAHLTQDGKVKGGSYIGHKVDIELFLRRDPEIKGHIVVNCEKKNRHGETSADNDAVEAWFKHTRTGLVPLERKPSVAEAIKEEEKKVDPKNEIRGLRLIGGLLDLEEAEKTG